MFVDEAVIDLQSGKGGAGATTFRRARGIPRGGPDGGDGGKGGDVWIVADSHKNTLVDYRHLGILKAESGAKGGHQKMTGRSGKDRILSVPPGTLVFVHETGELLADLAQPGSRVRVAAGGRGGKGNTFFATSTKRAPRYAQPGEPAVLVRVRMELKLVADVGIIGFPSVGKSTLISTISSCRPAIGDFPFTTLVPNLGVVERFANFPFVVADMPGLIEGAHEGKGLGIRFLKHIQRTALLLHLLDAAREDLVADYIAINHELASYDPELAARPQLVAVNKSDLFEPEELAQRLAPLQAHLGATKKRLYLISAASGAGIDSLLRTLAAKARLLKRSREKLSPDPIDQNPETT